MLLKRFLFIILSAMLLLTCIYEGMYIHDTTLSYLLIGVTGITFIIAILDYKYKG